MHIILLSGGSGRRLWPLSNDVRSKQFIRIFPAEGGKNTTLPAGAGETVHADAQPGSMAGSAAKAAGTASAPEAQTASMAASAAKEKTSAQVQGGPQDMLHPQTASCTQPASYESMAQRMLRQIRKVDPDATVTVATGKSQVSQLRSQLGDGIGISVEPCRRDTFPAIALATVYLHEVQGVPEEEPVVVCPVDPYVNEDYFLALRQLSDLARGDAANLTVMGIEPTYPSEKYGYVIPAAKDPVSPVRMFREKPDAQTAQKYIEQGALWNAGVFAYKLGYVLRKAHELIDFSDYDDFFAHYEDAPKISFDYAVAEKEPRIQVMRFAGGWKDMGTWNTLTEAMETPVIGRAVLNETCENVHVINELDVPVLVMGLRDAVVAASPEGILVSDKEQSSYIKPFVDAMDQQVMFAEKSWGSFQVLDVEEESLTMLVTLREGHQMNYHSHDHRDEIWNIISGEGRTIVDGMEQKVGPGDVITMQAGCRHTIVADTDMKLIEVQLGREISVHDKHKFELEI